MPKAAEHEATIKAKTGLLIDAYFSATKLKWLLDTIPGARARAAPGELAFGTIDTWLAWNLSAGRLHVTDASNASRTLLYDIHRRCWDEDLLMQFQADLLGVPVLHPRITETTALGAAYLAGLAVGLWKSAEDVAAHWQLERRFEPTMPTDQREQRLDDWRKAVRHTAAWARD